MVNWDWLWGKLGRYVSLSLAEMYGVGLNSALRIEQSIIPHQVRDFVGQNATDIAHAATAYIPTYVNLSRMAAEGDKMAKWASDYVKNRTDLPVEARLIVVELAMTAWQSNAKREIEISAMIDTVNFIVPIPFVNPIPAWKYGESDRKGLKNYGNPDAVSTIPRGTKYQRPPGFEHAPMIDLKETVDLIKVWAGPSVFGGHRIL
jgi:hypothetical protein